MFADTIFVPYPKNPTPHPRRTSIRITDIAEDFNNFVRVRESPRDRVFGRLINFFVNNFELIVSNPCRDIAYHVVDIWRGTRRASSGISAD